MAFKLFDRVQETTATTGTGTISLGGAVTGYRAFSSVFATGDTTHYVMSDGTNWEVGLGTLTTGTPWTLARTTILASSNAGAAVSFPGPTTNVWVDVAAAQAINGNLGTPTAGVLTSCTGLPISTGVSGLGTGIAAALAIATGTAGAPVLFNGALGTPTSGTLTSCTGLPVGSLTGATYTAAATGNVTIPGTTIKIAWGQIASATYALNSNTTKTATANITFTTVYSVHFMPVVTAGSGPITLGGNCTGATVTCYVNNSNTSTGYTFAIDYIVIGV